MKFNSMANCMNKYADNLELLGVPNMLQPIGALPTQLNLNKLLRYKNEKIIVRYSTDYPDAAMNAEEALQELLKFIWLCTKHKADKTMHPHDASLNFSCIIHAEMDDIDKMWHTFLLFTRDYQDFCTNYLDGVFFHHEPILPSDQSEFDLEYEQELTLYLSYIYDNLGLDTLLKWFKQS